MSSEAITDPLLYLLQNLGRGASFEFYLRHHFFGYLKETEGKKSLKRIQFLKKKSFVFFYNQGDWKKPSQNQLKNLKHALPSLLNS